MALGRATNVHVSLARIEGGIAHGKPARVVMRRSGQRLHQHWRKDDGGGAIVQKVDSLAEVGIGSDVVSGGDEAVLVNLRGEKGPGGIATASNQWIDAGRPRAATQSNA